MGYWQNHIASVADAKVVAAESIKFQDKKKLAELADIIAKFRAAGDFSPAGYESSGVSDWVLTLRTVANSDYSTLPSQV